MLVLPSKGACVERIILNESCTKAKIIFDDGSSVITATRNATPSGNKVITKKVTRTPTGVAVSKTIKKIKKHSISENRVPSNLLKVVKTKQGNIIVPNDQRLMQLHEKAQQIAEKSKMRAELLEKSTMDDSAIMANSMTDGQEVSL